MDKRFANDLIENTLKCFALDDKSFREFFPVRDGDRDTCFLWSYFAATGMLYQAVKAGYPLKDKFKSYVDAFVYYRTKPGQGKPVKYHSERGSEINGGHSDCFFDDNIWTARNYLFAYEVFHEPFYLEEAEKVADYVYTGWNEELGGVVWNENGLTDNATAQELERGLSANACSSLISAMLYRLTGKKHYLEWAYRFHDFCKIMQDPVTKVYYNGIHTLVENGKRRNGEVNKDMYGYNSGSMILVDLELYRITGEDKYLEDAKATSKAAYDAFLRKDEKSGKLYFRDFRWFTAILAEGWSALMDLGCENEKEYMKVLGESIDDAMCFMSPEGLLPHDLVCGYRDNNNDDRLLLTHSAIAEIAVLCSK